MSTLKICTVSCTFEPINLRVHNSNSGLCATTKKLPFRVRIHLQYRTANIKKFDLCMFIWYPYTSTIILCCQWHRTYILLPCFWFNNLYPKNKVFSFGGLITTYASTCTVTVCSRYEVQVLHLVNYTEFCYIVIFSWLLPRSD